MQGKNTEITSVKVLVIGLDNDKIQFNSKPEDTTSDGKHAKYD